MTPPSESNAAFDPDAVLPLLPAYSAKNRRTVIDELAAQIVARTGEPRPMIIAVDGHSSSGKTTLSRRLGDAVADAAVLHTDDLAWHHGVFSWDELLRDGVLPVVRAGKPLDYRPPQWQARGRTDSITLPGELAVLFVEGVGASQSSLRAEYDLVIWVESEEPTRFARDRVRLAAGEMSEDDFTSWMADGAAIPYGHGTPRPA